MRTTPYASPVVKLEISRFPYKERPYMPGSSTAPGRRGTRVDAPRRIAFHAFDRVGTQKMSFRGSMAGLYAPLSTLRRRPHGRLRMTRGQCGSLCLHRSGLPPPTPCRSPGAPKAPLTPRITRFIVPANTCRLSRAAGLRFVPPARRHRRYAHPALEARPDRLIRPAGGARRRRRSLGGLASGREDLSRPPDLIEYDPTSLYQPITTLALPL